VHELTKWCLPDTVERLTSALIETQIEIGYRREQRPTEIEGRLRQRIGEELLFSV
jgi:hypothetical protein